MTNTLKMTATKGLLFIAVGLSLSAAAGCSEDTSSRSQFSIAVSEEDLDFGTVWEQARYQMVVPLRNASSTSVEIASVKGPCYRTGFCASVSPESFELIVNETQLLELTLDLRLRPIPVKPSFKPREFSSRFEPSFSDGTYGAPFTVRGRVKPFYHLDMDVVYLGEILASGNAVPSSRILVKCLKPVKSISIACDPAILEASCLPLESNKRQAVVEISPSKAILNYSGVFKHEIGIQATCEDGEVVPATLLTVMGTVVPKVRAVPGAVHFGLVRRFEEVAELITLHTVENHRVIVEEIIADCDGMQVEAVGDSPQYRIILTPEKTGDIRGTVRFVMQAEGSDSPRVIEVEVIASVIKESAP